MQRSLFFLSLPELEKLCCVCLSLQDDEGEMRSRQMKTCRKLVLLYSDLLASPALDSFTEITVVMAMPFFQAGILQAYGQRRRLQLGSPQCVLPGVLQYCLSYSLITRLAPNWNKAGSYLISGRDFLTETGRLSAVSIELSITENQLCISVEANTVRLPPTTLEDFDLPPLVLRNFCGQTDSVLHTLSTRGPIWCHVLPSMKKGQIISISRQLPKDAPFRSYTDLQNHWNRLYGYRLPELAEEEVVYCSIYFKLVGERFFTYPLSCIRLQPVQRFPRVDPQGALLSFMSAVRSKLQSVCGFPARLTGKPCYLTTSLTSAASQQVLKGEAVNLTTVCSCRPVLTQIPAAAAARPLKPFFRSQPPAWPPLSLQARAQGILGNGYGSSQGAAGDGEWASLSSSFSSSSFSSGYQSAQIDSSSSFSVPLFQPVASFAATTSFFISSSSSSVLSPLPTPSQILVNPSPKLVPIFKNKCRTRHVNVALLQAQKEKEKLVGGEEERQRVSLPTIGKKRPAAVPVESSSSLSTSSSSMWPQRAHIPPPASIPRFSHPRPHGGTESRPILNHIPTLSAAPRPQPAPILSPHVHLKSKSKPQPDSSSECKTEGKAPKHQSAAPSQPSDVSSIRQGDVFVSKPKKSRSAIQDVDVEKMARSNQLSKVNSATLLAWLTGRGVAVRAKHKKDELMLKVMGCLAEA
ncbi:hypothetical protein LDENG_00139570 [Lucifuga dentata]|nr:hypothetical protein LDENG_00139570 [Lucifuga dentata]